jgi:hypothetical protein
VSASLTVPPGANLAAAPSYQPQALDAGAAAAAEPLTTKLAPQLPAGYPTMVLLALLPPLWFRVMDPRVAAVSATPT